ncbi:MAG: hypothetical protein O3A37_12740, partial [Planctomycetota bacterium]|nr:hypothetical protein [Planctomycetota bacterium]
WEGLKNGVIPPGKPQATQKSHSFCRHHLGGVTGLASLRQTFQSAVRSNLMRLLQDAAADTLSGKAFTRPWPKPNRYDSPPIIHS